jgi:hypothetical protein
LKENEYHDYKLHNLLVKHLSDQDQQRRVNYVAQVMVNLEINDNRFFHHVLWTDESRFEKMNIFGLQKIHILSIRLITKDTSELTFVVVLLMGI